MKYKLFFPTPLSEIDPENDNCDVCVTLENGEQYTIVVATPENLKHLMKKQGIPYIHPECLVAIVEKISEENIIKYIDYIIDKGNLLSIYGSDFTK